MISTRQAEKDLSDDEGSETASAARAPSRVAAESAVQQQQQGLTRAMTMGVGPAISQGASALNVAAGATAASNDLASPSRLLRAVLEACTAVQPESVEKLKTLITWQRSSIASFAVKVRTQEAALAEEVAQGLTPASHAAPSEVAISRDSAHWAETQLTLAFLEGGADQGAQQLLQAVRAAQAEGEELPPAPPALTEAADGVDPVSLCAQLIAELSELAALHSRSEWLEARMHRIVE